MKRWLKTYLSVSIIAWHLFSGFLALVVMRDGPRRRRYFQRAVSRHSRWVMRVFNLHLAIDGKINARRGQNYLIVANHMSYLDAIIMSSFRPTAFVTSIEMKQTPVLGQILDTGGCLYVERRSKENIQKEIGQIEDALRDGFDVVVFPEATSSDGSKVLPFKRPLFAAAARAGVPVLPVVIQYEYIDGQPVTAVNRDQLAWYGPMSFGPHFLGLMKMRRIDMRLKVLPEIPVTPESTRDTLMEQAQAAIRAEYRPII